MGMFLMLVLVLVFLISYFRAYAYRHIHSRYLFEIIIIILFLGVNLISLWINLERFNSYSSLIFYAFASLAVWSAFFMSWLIYVQSQHTRGQWLGWGLLLFLAVVAFWQIFDYSASKQLTQYFVSADALQAKAISSITRWHTIYGVMAAIGILVALQKLFKVQQAWWPRLFFLFLIALLTYTGVLGESRNFLFTLAIGLSLYLFRYLLIKPKIVLIFLASAMVLFHAVIIKNERLSHEYGQIFPYITKLKHTQLPHYNDFIPQINNHSLTGRADVWQQGYRLWQKSPWLGIGPGAYRVMNLDDEQHRNLHNYYFQVLVDTGITGFLLLVILIILLLRRAYRANNLVIFIAVLGSLLFDNYLDYSFAWVFIMSWFLFVSKLNTEPKSLMS